MTMNNLKPLMAVDGSELAVLVQMVMRCHGLSLVDGSTGGVSPEGVACVNAMVNDVFGWSASRYGSLEEQASDIAVRIASERPFKTCNDETAVLCAMTVLDAYGHPVACSQDAVREAVMACRSGDADEVVRLLCSYE